MPGAEARTERLEASNDWQRGNGHGSGATAWLAIGIQLDACRASQY